MSPLYAALTAPLVLPALLHDGAIPEAAAEAFLAAIPVPEYRPEHKPTTGGAVDGAAGLPRVRRQEGRVNARAIAKPAAERVPLDAYDTPLPLATAICLRLAELIPVPRVVLEPSAGCGIFLRAFNAAWPLDTTATVAIDIAPRAGLVKREDFFAHADTYPLVCGNPPFRLALEFTRHALLLTEHRGHVAFLLPLSFLGGSARAALYREHPLRWLLPIAGRPSFDGKGTGSQEYFVGVWERGHTGNGEVLAPLEWKGAR